METECRKCEECRRARSRLWRRRALAETGAASRSWMGTITLTPDAQFKAIAQARHDMAAQGVDFDTLPEAEQFRLRCTAISPEVTKFLKRVRKNSGAPLRYLFVAEVTQAGDPHFHVLLHECDPGRPVRHTVLKGAWHLGFTDWRLVKDAKQAAYVCKYLSKDAAARVRASLHYGQPTTYVDSERERSVNRDPTAKPFSAAESGRKDGSEVNARTDPNGISGSIQDGKQGVSRLSTEGKPIRQLPAIPDKPSGAVGGTDPAAAAGLPGSTSRSIRMEQSFRAAVRAIWGSADDGW